MAWQAAWNVTSNLNWSFYLIENTLSFILSDIVHCWDQISSNDKSEIIFSFSLSSDFRCVFSSSNVFITLTTFSRLVTHWSNSLARSLTTSLTSAMQPCFCFCMYKYSMAKQDFIAWYLILCSLCEIDLIWH